MFCTNCGKELANGSNFCPECGTAVVRDTYEHAEPSDPRLDQAPLEPVIQPEVRTHPLDDSWIRFVLLHSAGGAYTLHNRKKQSEQRPPKRRFKRAHRCGNRHFDRGSRPLGADLQLLCLLCLNNCSYFFCLKIKNRPNTGRFFISTDTNKNFLIFFEKGVAI